MTLQVGDRVMVTSESYFRIAPSGVGTILALGGLSANGVTVAFDNWDGGHGGMGPLSYPIEVQQFITGNNLWYINRRNITLLKSTSTKDIHPDNLKYIKIITKMRYLDRKFKERNTPCLAA